MKEKTKMQKTCKDKNKSKHGKNSKTIWRQMNFIKLLHLNKTFEEAWKFKVKIYASNGVIRPLNSDVLGKLIELSQIENFYFDF